MAFVSINPTTGETLGTYPEHTDLEVDRKLDAADAAQRLWAQEPLERRAELLRGVAAALRRRADGLARLMALEMGKPLAQGVSEVEKCAWVCEHYADHGAEALAPVEIPTDPRRSAVHFRPMGLILAVMPWNFPFWQVFRFLAPALLAGNGGVLKHAPSVPGCADAIVDMLRGAGFPPDLFPNLRIPPERVQRVLGHPKVRAATLTGSTAAGRAVAAQAGERLKKTVLELGGSDPYLVLADADVEAAARICATSRLLNSGQSCIAAKRLVVVESVRGEFEARFVAHMAAAVVGDPLDPGVEVGPMARRDLRDGLHRQVLRSLEGGARCLLGGQPPEGPGAFYPPTVLTDVGPGTPAYGEELFGPVAAVLPVRDEAEAIRVANDSPYGLGAAVFTRDLERGERIASEELDAGCCCVNGLVQSDPRLPFGGVKDSGYGRELGQFGIREFVNVKTVSVA
ncbi:MAG: NAD-dependent succinate-semialdehyde dehydrogenase [Acidobacteriota bacterium]